LGETLLEGVSREMLEETGIAVRVLDLIEVFERINPYSTPASRDANVRPRFHFVIVDYLCEKITGEATAGGDATDVAYVSEEDLPQYQLTETAMRVLRSAFAMDRSRRAVPQS
jgi:8-oxo-dGTP diphosphatase